MNILETKYAGLTLRNPLIIGSSGLTKNARDNRRLCELGAGAIVIKSIFEEQIEMQGKALLNSSTDAPEAADYIANYVRANQLDEHLSLVRDTKLACDIPVIASINCTKASAWTEFAAKFQEAGADALELNVFRLCTDLNTTANELYEQYVAILQQVRRSVSIPVIIKLGKGFSNIPGLVNRLKINGAAGVVLFNRYYSPDIDIERLKVVSGSVFSTTEELGDTLRWTAIVAGAVPDISIAASTGVHSAADVVKCLLAGADAVQLCSVLYQQGVETLTSILDGLKNWMTEKKYRTVQDFRGKLSFDRTDDPSLYERAQFMKYFSNA
jgi:dihydroorotate dehydrogenase (fumarate)